MRRVLSGDPVTPQCGHGLHGLVTGVVWSLASVFPTSSLRNSVQVSVLWVSAFSFCMLFCVRSCQGAEKYMGTQRPGSSGHLWPRKFSVVEAVFPCIGLVIAASFPGQSFPSGWSCVAPAHLACHRALMGLPVNPSGLAGVMEAPLTAPENWASLRSGSKNRSLWQETYSAQDGR